MTWCFAESPTIWNMCLKHMQTLRAERLYQNALLVILYEGNSTWESADNLARKMHMHTELSPLVFDTRPRNTPKGGVHTTNITSQGVVNSGPTSYFDDENVHVGIYTGPMEKLGARDLLEKSLQMRRLCYAERFISGDEKTVKDELLKQMAGFRLEVAAPKDPVFGKAKWGMTGKDKSGLNKDDVWMSIMNAMAHWKRLTEDSSWVERIQALGYAFC